MKKAASLRWRLFGNASESFFRVSAVLPPPAAWESSTKNKSWRGLRSWEALITRHSGRRHSFIGKHQRGSADFLRLQDQRTSPFRIFRPTIGAREPTDPAGTWQAIIDEMGAPFRVAAIAESAHFVP